MRNILREVIFFDDGVGPQGAHDFVFFYDSVGVLDQVKEGVEDFGREGDRLAAAQELAFGGVDAEVGEFVDLARHAVFIALSERFSAG